MPLKYDVDPDRAHVTVVGNGDLAMSEMIAVVERVAEDRRFRPHFSLIFDLRNADYAAELTDGDAFAEVLRRRRDDFEGEFALLVSENLHFLARLYCVLASLGGFPRMHCFTDIEEARTACGLQG